MNNQRRPAEFALVPPIKVVSRQAASVVPSGAGATGTVVFFLFVPSHRIHYSVDVAAFSPNDVDLSASTWTLEPCSGAYPAGAGNELPPVVDLAPLQAVISAGPLPDGYEGESLTQVWKLTLNLDLTTAKGSSQGGIFVTAQFEPAEFEMTGEERSYWFNQCRLQRSGAELTLSPPL